MADGFDDAVLGQALPSTSYEQRFLQGRERSDIYSFYSPYQNPEAWERAGARPSAPGPAMQSEQLLRREIRLLTRLAGQIEMLRLLAEADLITQKLRSVHRRSAYFGLPAPISGAPASLYAQIKARA